MGFAPDDRDALLNEMAATMDSPDGVERSNESWNWVIWMLFGLLTVEVFLASLAMVVTPATAALLFGLSGAASGMPDTAI